MKLLNRANPGIQAKVIVVWRNYLYSFFLFQEIKRVSSICSIIKYRMLGETVFRLIQGEQTLEKLSSLLNLARFACLKARIYEYHSTIYWVGY